MAVQSVKHLYGYRIGAADGDIGHVRDAYFDDLRWAIRYLVVDTSHWLPGRRVLISPLSLREVDPARRLVHAALTKSQVARSPDVDTDKPVSRQREIELYRYYGFPYHWSGVDLQDSVPDLTPMAASGALFALEHEAAVHAGLEEGYDPHLRSARSVMGYYVHALDGDVGHVADILFDDQTWSVKHVVVTTGSLWPSYKVLVPVGWISRVSWPASTVDIELRSEAVRTAPAFDPARMPSAADEAHLLRHYGPPPFDQA
jgi:sporulation protein YlmC with PRC-barrel domain